MTDNSTTFKVHDNIPHWFLFQDLKMDQLETNIAFFVELFLELHCLCLFVCNALRELLSCPELHQLCENEHLGTWVHSAVVWAENLKKLLPRTSSSTSSLQELLAELIVIKLWSNCCDIDTELGGCYREKKLCILLNSA